MIVAVPGIFQSAVHSPWSPRTIVTEVPGDRCAGGEVLQRRTQFPSTPEPQNL
jgi:hypothetical protein